MNPNRLVLAVGLGVFLAARASSADDDSDRVAADRLAAIVHERAAADDRTRVPIIAAFITAGAISLGAGIPLLVDATSRPQPFTNGYVGELITGAVLTALGGASLLSWPAAFISTPFERLDARIRAVPASPGRLADEEAILARAAAAERGNRKTSAILFFVLSGVNAASVALDLTTQNQWLGAVNGVASFACMIAGVAVLVTPGAMEELWRTWRIGTGRPAAGVRFTPLVGPTSGGFALTF